MMSNTAILLRWLPLLVLLAGCDGRMNAEAGADGERWILEEDLRIGQLDGPAEYMFGSIRSVFPGPDGGLWVLDSQVPELRLYDSEGLFVRRVGRSGGGPGEFSGSNVCAHRGPDGEIWVEDSARRWNRFDASGTLLGTLPVTSTLGCGIRYWTHDGRMLAVNSDLVPGPTLEFKSSFVEYRMSSEMDQMIPGDTFPTPAVGSGQQFTYAVGDRGRVTQMVPFSHRPTWIVTDDGFWTSPGDGRYRIAHLSFSGDTLWTVERGYTPVAIPDSMRRAEYQRFSPEALGVSVLSLSDLPAAFPPFERLMRADDGRMWVLRRSGPDAFELDVFSPAGEYLGTALTPLGFDRFSIYHISAEQIYGVYRDELDVPYAVRLSIRRA